ncbi:hypothetical protein C8Q75DRAFT_369450 [Abortiporus biennis]|nr:hypothetical protein C8Q75DRAFT_369450 [Abortiporus biennis]
MSSIADLIRAVERMSLADPGSDNKEVSSHSSTKDPIVSSCDVTTGDEVDPQDGLALDDSPDSLLNIDKTIDYLIYNMDLQHQIMYLNADLAASESSRRTMSERLKSLQESEQSHKEQAANLVADNAKLNEVIRRLNPGEIMKKEKALEEKNAKLTEELRRLRMKHAFENDALQTRNAHLVQVSLRHRITYISRCLIYKWYIYSN